MEKLYGVKIAIKKKSPLLLALFNANEFQPIRSAQDCGSGGLWEAKVKFLLERKILKTRQPAGSLGAIGSPLLVT